MNNNYKLVSQCCDANLILMGGEHEGATCWYRCSKCNSDCNPKKVENSEV
jgi:hypothetical protein